MLLAWEAKPLRASAVMRLVRANHFLPIHKHYYSGYHFLFLPTLMRAQTVQSQLSIRVVKEAITLSPQD